MPCTQAHDPFNGGLYTSSRLHSLALRALDKQLSSPLGLLCGLCVLSAVDRFHGCAFRATSSDSGTAFDAPSVYCTLYVVRGSVIRAYYVIRFVTSV